MIVIIDKKSMVCDSKPCVEAKLHSIIKMGNKHPDIRVWCIEIKELKDLIHFKNKYDCDLLISEFWNSEEISVTMLC